jgi:hypothetical protein
MRFFTFAALVIAAAILQLKLKPLLGWAPDFLVVALIAASFYFRAGQDKGVYAAFSEFFFLVLLGVWFLNWHPGLSGDVLFYAALPLATFFLHPLFPWRPWFVNLFLGILSIAVFYLVSAGYGAVVAEPAVFWENIFWSSLFGFAAFKIYGSIQS